MNRTQLNALRDYRRLSPSGRAGNPIDAQLEMTARAMCLARERAFTVTYYGPPPTWAYNVVPFMPVR